MRKSRLINHLAKSRLVRTLGVAAVMLLFMEPYAKALDPVVFKYPTGYTIAVSPMGNGMSHEDGTVFGFNSVKSDGDADAYATIQEGGCFAPDTRYDFTAGREGFTTTTATSVSYGYSGVQGKTGPGSLQTRLNNSTTARTYVWNKTFLWDCGIPSGTVPVSIWFKRSPTWVNEGAACTLGVNLVKPDASVVTLIAATDIRGAADSPWIQLTAADAAAHFNQIGVYTLRATGTLQGLAGSNLYLFLDDFELGLTSGYASYTQDVEFTVRATPYSNIGANAYKLDIRARKISGDTETTDIQVWNGATWNTRYSVTAGHTAFTTFNSYFLTTAEYNNGNVRVRYIDTLTSNDTNYGGIDVEYQRVTVDQGVCVDQVRDIEADCGKCHNYNGDITKPWPALGKHNFHAQTESISDCLWCHPNNGTDSAHRDGSVKIAGTKVYRAADGNLNGAPVNALYDGTSKQCSNVDCHRNLTTPAWTATYAASGFNGTTIIARNCSRCHNSGTAGADNATNLNLNVAWPSTGDGGGHTSHNTAFTMDEYSCQSNGSCHPDNRGQHTPVGDGVVVVKMAPNYGSPNQVIKYMKDATNGTGTCANVSCHGGQVTPRFNLSSTNPINVTTANGSGCIRCHAAEQANGWGTGPGNAAQYNAPLSGLHRGSPAISGQDHAEGLTNRCNACHNTAGLLNHFKNQSDGKTNLDTPAMNPVVAGDFIAAPGYLPGTGTAPNYTTPPTCGTAGATTCHAENRTANRNAAAVWRRKWNWDSYDTTDPVKPCNNCHGHWGTFASGVVEPHVMSNADLTLRNALKNNHNDSGVNCGTMCHGQTDATYNHGVVVGAATKNSSLNNNAGFVDGGTYVGCNGCHLNEGQVAPDGAGGNHVFTDATWVNTQMLNGPLVTCYNPGNSAGCHGNHTNQYWPNGSAYPDREGRHDEHMAKLAAKLAITLPGNDADQKRMCQYCHPASPGAGGHGTNSGDSIADVNAINPIWDAANPPATADTGAAFSNTAAATCASIDCHNNKDTTAGTFGWRDTGTSTCLMCHTLGGTGANPATGLHNITVAGPQHHDDGIAGGCAACHSAAPPTTHINGTYADDTAVRTDRFLTARSGMFVDNGSANRGTCSGTGNLTGCHTDNGNWARLWSTEANSTATAPASTRCNVCHGQWSSIAGSAGWAAGTTHYKAGGTNSVTNTRGSGHDTTTCDNCHVYGAGGNGRHNVVTRQINLNSNGVTSGRTGSTYGTDTAGCGACHGAQADTGHNLPISFFPTATVAGVVFPMPTCTSCHTSGSGGAPIVRIGTTAGSSSGHVDADGAGAGKTINVAGATAKCEDCHSGHADGTSGANDVEIPTTYSGGLVPAMNYQYNSGTHSSRIKLGGTSTLATATTEAQMCWACHDTVGVSEWGANQHTTTGNSAYDFGDLYTNNNSLPGTKDSNWTTGFWRSGKGRSSASTSNPYWYKRGAIQSTHSVNFDSGTVGITTGAIATGFGRTETKDVVANIRCSWCHDVHGTHNGQKGDPAGTGTADQPYLRGTWKGNPYSEDGAPILGMSTWSAQGSLGAVPRANAAPGNTGSAGATSVGGWWIDQNSNNPNSTTNVHATSGLCEQCHGTNKTGTWATANLGTINYASAGNEANLWVSGYNGHANSVINAPGPGAAAGAENRARNIFTRTLRGTSYRATGNPSHYVDMGLMTHNSSQSRSYRGQSGFNWTPSAGQETTAQRGFAWGTAVQGVSGQTTKWAVGTLGLTMQTANTETAHDAQANFHTFTCSKCHNPHASRLPKLMITNCLDTNHNTWEDSTTFTGTTAPTGVFASTRHSQWPSAQNCHRLDARATLTTGAATTLGSGWNRATPWREFNTPNATRSTTTPDVAVP